LKDFLVIGGGVAGASISYFLQQRGYCVTLFEQHHLGFGGSGAAGAFLNPKVRKRGELSHLVNSAIQYSTQLYLDYFPKYIHQSTLNHINSDSTTTRVSGAVVDADGILKSFTDEVDIKFLKVSDIKFLNGSWRVEGIDGKYLILATGAFPLLIDEPYLRIRPVWGERLDIYSDRVLQESYHKDISISQTVNGVIRVGATHFRGVLERESNPKEREELLREANSIVKLTNSKIVKSYSGVRSASFDFFPILGRVVKSKETIEKFPQIRNGRKYNPNEYIFHRNLFLFTGVGGYGFSLAPYLANIFVDRFENGEMMDNNIEPYRFFSRWVKKRG